MKWGLRLLGCAIAGVALLFVLAGTFWLGTRVGALQATRWSTEPQGRLPIEPPFSPFGVKPRPHGAVGSVLRIEGESIVIRGQFGVERTVRITPDTVIERSGQRISLNDIQAGEWLIAIGSPRPDNSMDARLIRVFELHSEGEPHDERMDFLIHPTEYEKCRNIHMTEWRGESNGRCS
jgi:hypothetical protein